MTEEVTKTDYRRHRNRAIRGAFSKGVAAGRSGRGIDFCPYQKPEEHAGGSWSDAFRNAWNIGWEEGRLWREEHAAPI